MALRLYAFLMQNTVSLKKVSHPRYEYRVRWRESEKDLQKWFGKGQKEAAKIFKQQKGIELGNHGAKHGTIADDERAALIVFRSAVAGMPEPRPCLLDAVNSFLASIANQLKPTSIHELIAQRAAAAEERGVHARTLRDLIGADGTKGRLGAFAAKFGDRQVAGVTSEEIKQWVGEHCSTKANRREMLVRVNGLFAYGVKQECLKVNPVSKLEIRRPDGGNARILTVKECAKLLSACPPRSLPAVAIQLFAGLRRAEVERLDWQFVDLESATVKVIQRKGTGTRREKSRFAPLHPTLQEWLAPHRQLAGLVFPTGRTEGKVSEQNYRKDFEKARHDAGLTDWDENTLRHSFGSYRVADINSLEQVKLEMGHTTSTTTSEHYVNAVKKQDAEAFWKLRPQTTRPANVTSLKRKSA